MNANDLIQRIRIGNQKKAIDQLESQQIDDEIATGVSNRVIDFLIYFPFWMIGNMVLIMAVIGAGDLSLTLSTPLWRTFFILSLIAFSLLWDLVIPLFMLLKMGMICFGLVCMTVEDYIKHNHPLLIGQNESWGIREYMMEHL